MSNSTPSYTHARRKQNTHLDVPLCLCVFPWILKTTLIDWITDSISTHMATDGNRTWSLQMSFSSFFSLCWLVPSSQPVNAILQIIFEMIYWIKIQRSDWIRPHWLSYSGFLYSLIPFLYSSGKSTRIKYKVQRQKQGKSWTDSLGKWKQRKVFWSF